MSDKYRAKLHRSEGRQIFYSGIQSKKRMKKYESILSSKDTTNNNSNSLNKNKYTCPSRMSYARTKLLAGRMTKSICSV